MSKGRPVLFRGASAQVVANILAKHGLKGGQAYIAEVGVRIPGKGTGRTPLKVSLPTLAKVAAEHGVEFQRGRPTDGKAVKVTSKPKAVKVKVKAVAPTGKKRGRPLGSKNKPASEVKAVAPTGKKRGRPVGSKNKPKDVAPVAPVENTVEVARADGELVCLPVEVSVEVAPAPAPVEVPASEVATVPAPVEVAA